MVVPVAEVRLPRLAAAVAQAAGVAPEPRPQQEPVVVVAVAELASSAAASDLRPAGRVRTPRPDRTCMPRFATSAYGTSWARP